MPDLVLTERDNGAAVDVKPGGSVEIDLAENGTTGYQWTIADALPPFVRTTAEAHNAPKTDAAAGAGGRAHFTFTVTGSGSGEIVLQNRRSWEPQPLETYRVRVSSRAP